MLLYHFVIIQLILFSVYILQSFLNIKWRCLKKLESILGSTPKLLRTFKEQSSKVEVLLDLKVKLIQWCSKAKTHAFFGGANLNQKKKSKHFFLLEILMCCVYRMCTCTLNLGFMRTLCSSVP